MEMMGYVLIVLTVIGLLMLLVVAAVLTHVGAYWIQAYMSDANVSMRSLISMTFLRVNHHLIVTAKIMGRQAGLPLDGESGMSTASLIAHHLAGGDIRKVMQAIIVAQRAGFDLEFDRAAAIDLAGRDVLRAVQTSVSPVVISCPPQDGGSKRSLSAVAKNGVEILVGLKVTVRTNLDQLIGGATQETIIARVGQAIISAVGSADSHMEVMAVPSQISKKAMTYCIDSNTAYSILSIDISDIDVGANIGARLQLDQAMAETQVAQALAEARLAEAVAEMQLMKANVKEAQSNFILAEALLPPALAHAFRGGQFQTAAATDIHDNDPEQILKFERRDRA